MSQPWWPSGLERGRGCGPFVASARSERAAGVRSADSQSAVPKAWTPHRLIKSEDTITHSPNRERKRPQPLTQSTAGTSITRHHQRQGRRQTQSSAFPASYSSCQAAAAACSWGAASAACSWDAARAPGAAPGAPEAAPAIYLLFLLSSAAASC